MVEIPYGGYSWCQVSWKETGGWLHDGPVFEAARLKEPSNLGPLVADIQLRFFSHFGLVFLTMTHSSLLCLQCSIVFMPLHVESI